MLRKRLHLSMLGLLLAAAFAAAPAAQAGTYTAYSCNQSPAQDYPDWHDDQTAGFSGGLPYFYDNRDCTSFGLYRRFENNGVAGGAYDALTFVAPKDTYIEKAQLLQSLAIRTPGAYDAIYAQLEDGSRATLANYTSGTVGDAWYDMPTGSSHAIRLRTELGCQAAMLSCTGTTASGTGNEWYLRGAIVYLVDPFLPTFSSTGGAGWNAAPADGVSPVTYSVADKGSGVSVVRFFIDGVEHAVDTVACVQKASVPCALSTSGDFQLDTTKLSEGVHTIAMRVRDQSGNQTAMADKQMTITVRRTPQAAPATPVTTTNPNAGSGGAPAVGDHLSGSNGGWSGSDLTYTYQWQRCDSAGANCTPIDGANGLNYTATSADVGHTLQFCVTATNSGGSATSCSEPTPAVVQTRPTTPTGGSGSGSTSDALPTSAGGPAPTPASTHTTTTTSTTTATSVATVDRGAPNGSGASDKVVLTVANSRTSTQKVKFGKRVPISGRLMNPSGAPIGGAVLAVQVQTAVPGASMSDAGLVKTGADGRFTYVAPAGPSRVVRFGYRAYTADSSFADTTDVRLLVAAGVTLKATPKKVRNRKATVFTGRLLGKPMSKRGVVVDLQVFFRKQWRTFAAPRTNRAGAFKFKYRFMAGAATWKFRARVRKESSYPFELGYSLKPVKVKVTN